MICGINTWAVGVVRYSVGIVDWTVEEVASMDRKTRKILSMNSCLHTRSNVGGCTCRERKGEEDWLVLRSV